MHGLKTVKEQVFQDSPDITIERIGVKHNNLKASWTAGRKKLDGTGYGSKKGGTIMEEVEKKYPFFKRLDKIFGTRPNACLGTSLDTITETITITRGVFSTFTAKLFSCTSAKWLP